MTLLPPGSSNIGLKRAVYDALDHAQLADAIAAHLDTLPLGSVIAIHGSWGRGKTDVLARVFDQFDVRAEAGPRPLWLNPWQYGTPDLITPVVIEMLSRIQPSQRRGNKPLREAAKTLLRAGSAMAFKAVSVVAPFGQVFGAGEKAVDDFLKELFDESPSGSHPDLDPVAAMAERYRDLVAEYMRLVNQPAGRLLVCVDDLDRCLPDHQIAMLEAIHFLTAAEANCSFLVALDPVLVQKAAETHYRTTGFDSSRYLDKLFDLRINLPALTSDKIGPLVRTFVEGDVSSRTGQDTVAEAMLTAFDVDASVVASQFGDVFGLPELTNPRLILRVLQRLQLLANALVASSDERLRGESWLRPVLILSAISERWPQLRQVLQGSSPEAWFGNTSLICFYYGISAVAETDEDRATLREALTSHMNLTLRLPTKEQSPDLGEFLYQEVLADGDDRVIKSLLHCEQVLANYGL